MQKFSSYLIENTVRLHCREQLVNVVWGKTVAVFSEDSSNLTNGKQCGQKEELVESFPFPYAL